MQRSDLDITTVGQSGTVKHLSFEETTCGKNNLGLNAELHFQAGSARQRFKGFCWVVTIFFSLGAAKVFPGFMPQQVAVNR